MPLGKIGKVLGLGGVERRDQTTTNKMFQQKQYEDLLNRAEALYSQDFGPEFQQAMAEERANLAAGRGLSQQSEQILQDLLSEDGQLAKVARGAYLDPNSPQYRAMYDAATRPVLENYQNVIQPALQSQAMQAGRWGSVAQQREANKAGEQLTRQLGDISTRLYDNERTRQMGALSRQAQLGSQLGNMQGNTTRRLAALDPYALQKDRLTDFKGNIAGSMGSSSTTPYYGPDADSRAAAGLGALMESGASLLKAFG